MNQWHYSQAARKLHQGGVVAYPTEAVWGLGCDPFNEAAVNKLLLLKKRPVEKGVILIAAAIEQVSYLLDPLSASEIDTLSASWPGPNTWLIPDVLNQTPAWIKGKHKSVAVRVSDHSGVQKLCQAYGGAIVSTSANPGGATPARNSFEVGVYFGCRVDYCLPGKLGGLAKPTQIRDLRSSDIIRK